jgi:secreted Zn-dependent insulinase-like peptidase
MIRVPVEHVLDVVNIADRYDAQAIKDRLAKVALINTLCTQQIQVAENSGGNFIAVRQAFIGEGNRDMDYVEWLADTMIRVPVEHVLDVVNIADRYEEIELQHVG